MTIVGVELQPGCMADRLLTGLGQPQLNPWAQKEREKSSVLLRKEIMNKLVADLLQQKGLGCWKLVRKRCKQKEECFLSSRTWWSWQNNYLRLDISNNLSCALSCLHLSGHTFLVQRMRHNRNRRLYELRICDRCNKCDWHSVQDEEPILLDCSHEHLVSLRTQHRQLAFPPQYEDSPTRLRTFLNQPDINGVASFVAKCLALFPWFFPLRCPPDI